MKKRLALLLLFLPAFSSVATLPGPFVAATGTLHGKPYEIILSHSEHVTTLWNPEKDDWPMQTTEAIHRAREALGKVVGESAQHFGCIEARLRRFYSHPREERAQWYFIVVFESDHESVAPRADRGYIPAVLPFLVFPEGYVKSPTPKQ